MNHTIETALAVQNLRGPLNPSPNPNTDRYLNELRMRFRTYFVEYCVSQGAVMLPRMFAEDFRGEVSRIATLVDSDGNQFECLVDKMNGNVYFTRGWAALRDFYDIRIGAWIMLLYAGNNHFGMIVVDRFHDPVDQPVFYPPARFVIDMDNVPLDFLDDLPESTELLSYTHNPAFFNLHYDMGLTNDDVTTGSLMLPYDGFGEFAFDKATTAVKLVDDCGNAWDCTFGYVSFPFKQFKVGGEWSKLVAARRLSVGERVRVGSEPSGHSQTIYLMFRP